MVVISYTDPEKRLSQLMIYEFPYHFIMSPKDFMEYESGFGKEVHWWYLADLMLHALRNARTSYAYQLVEGCIYYSILALEYGLKAKYCRFLSEGENHAVADEWLVNKTSRPSLGTFSHPISSPGLYSSMQIENLSVQVRGLNELRTGLFHFNWEKLRSAIKHLGFDSTEWEEEGFTIIYPNLIDDTLAINVNNCVINLLNTIFLPNDRQLHN